MVTAWYILEVKPGSENTVMAALKKVEGLESATRVMHAHPELHGGIDILVEVILSDEFAVKHFLRDKVWSIPDVLKAQTLKKVTDEENQPTR